MKLSMSWVALGVTVLGVVYAFEVPSCGASNCLTDGVFYTCAPSDLVCLCAKDQPLIDQYVDAITPCLESEDRKNECTDGALYQYKDLLVQVCSGQGKSVVW